jgi:hypothetical protein
MTHPAYSVQLRDEIRELISAAMEREEVSEEDAQRVLLDIANEMQPFEPPEDT